MDMLKELKDIKQTLLDDLKKSIIYVPDRGRDIYLMMNKYLSNRTPKEEKENILTNLSKCINNQKYEQPEGAIIDNYTLDEIERFNDSLDKFFENLQQNPKKVGELSEILDKEINDLQVETKMHFLDTWRIDTICNWYNLACSITAQNLNSVDIEPEDFGKYDIGRSL